MAERKAEAFDAFLDRTPELAELLEHIVVGTKWYFVGTLLHLEDKKLDSIDQLQGYNDESKTLKMFQHWLTTTPTASRRQVLQVLRKRVIGEMKIADEYEKKLRELFATDKYTSDEAAAQSILSKYIPLLSQALLSPVQVSELLYSKRCVNETALDEMERMDPSMSLDDKRNILLTDIQKTVSSDYRKLKDIATVLSDVEEAKSIAYTMMTEYVETVTEDSTSHVQGDDKGHDNACDILRNNYSALSQSITKPVRVAECLRAENVLSDDSFSCIISARGSLSDCRAFLLKAVRHAIKSDYKCLELFVAVLRKFSETAFIGDNIHKEYRQNYMNEDEKEELEIHLKEERKSHAASELASIGSESESIKEAMDTLHGHKIHFPRNMRKEFKEMRLTFGTTFFQVRRNFCSNKALVDINDMKLLVIDCFPDLEPQLFHKKTINEVLDVVKRKCSIINVRPLEVLTTVFGIKEAEKKLRSYKNKAKDFCKSLSVQLCLSEELQAVHTPRLKSETVVFILNWDPDKSTLQDIDDVLQELEPLGNYRVQIDQVRDGESVVVTCYCPTEYMTPLITTVINKILILEKRGLKEFIVGNSTVWDNSALKVLLAEDPEEIDKVVVSNFGMSIGANLIISMRKDLQKSQESIDELNKKLQIRSDIDKGKSKEIEVLRSTMIHRNEEIADLKKRSESRLQEIEQLKLELEAIQAELESSEEVHEREQLQLKLKDITLQGKKTDSNKPLIHSSSRQFSISSAQSTRQEDYTAVYCGEQQAHIGKMWREKYEDKCVIHDNDDEILVSLENPSCREVFMHADPQDPVVKAVMSRGYPRNREKLKWWHIVDKDKTPNHLIEAEGFKIVQVEDDSSNFDTLQLGMMKTENPTLNHMTAVIEETNSNGYITTSSHNTSYHTGTEKRPVDETDGVTTSTTNEEDATVIKELLEESIAEQKKTNEILAKIQGTSEKQLETSIEGATKDIRKIQLDLLVDTMPSEVQEDEFLIKAKKRSIDENDSVTTSTANGGDPIIKELLEEQWKTNKILAKIQENSKIQLETSIKNTEAAKGILRIQKDLVEGTASSEVQDTRV